MTKKLSRNEKETIILFNEGEPDAEIFTYSKAWQKRLEKNLGIEPDMVNDAGGKGYVIDKKRIPLPRAKRKMTESQKKALRDAGKKPR